MAKRTTRSRTKTKTATGRVGRSARTSRRPKRAAKSRKVTTRRASSRKRAAAPRRVALRVTPAMARLAKEMTKLLAEEAMPLDAVTLLMRDHTEVDNLFKTFDATDSRTEKGKIATKICLMLTVHATIEEELLYPASRRELEDHLIDEAIVEHATAKQLIADIEAMKPSEGLYDAKVKVLGEYIRHHVKEEENELFPQLQASELDLVELGEKLMERKRALFENAGARS